MLPELVTRHIVANAQHRRKNLHVKAKARHSSGYQVALTKLRDPPVGNVIDAGTSRLLKCSGVHSLVADYTATPVPEAVVIPQALPLMVRRRRR